MNTLRIAAALAAFACGSAYAADPATEAPASAAIGTWRLNVDESIPPQGRSLRPFTLTIRQSGEILDFTQTETGADGKIRSFSHRTPTDGVTRDVPDMPGARMAMTLLPSGIIDAKFWLPNESLQHKFCVMERSLKRQVCLATITAPTGEVVFFKHVLDKVE